MADLNLTSPSALNASWIIIFWKEVIQLHEQRLKPPFISVDLTGWQLPDSFVPRTLLGEPCPPSYVHSTHCSNPWTFQHPGRPVFTLSVFTDF
ncbi:hypothetical protein CRENBAI_000519 [Crenichthys baileyi]|uniref:Uncharacterized protein n=1 Tax=Crenichthys baileyi TaxID=28760 RepID=A0AAV9S622_9TELE